jgi:hypothetical protein
MASLEELYKKSDAAKLPLKKDRTPISSDDYDYKKINPSETQLEKSRGGKLNLKKYSDSIKR